MFINLTPHAVNIVNIVTIPASGNVARVSTASFQVSEHEGVPFFSQETGEVTGLPDFQEGVFLIVSAMVRVAVPHRKDVCSPGDMVRDAQGNILGCRNLIINN